MTLSISLHLLIGVMMMIIIIILLSSIVSCFLMITSSKRFFHSIRTETTVCVLLSLISLKLVGRKRAREWMRTALALIATHPYRLPMICYICAVVFFSLSLSRSHFFNENNENALKINIILPLYVSASDLLFIAKIFCWFVARLYIWSLCLNLSDWELIRNETKPNLIKIQQIYQSHYLIELQ